MLGGIGLLTKLTYFNANLYSPMFQAIRLSDEIASSTFRELVLGARNIPLANCCKG